MPTSIHPQSIDRPTGLKILSVYMTGSKNMSYDSASLTTSDIKVRDWESCVFQFFYDNLHTCRLTTDDATRTSTNHAIIQWLGVRPSDLDRYNLPEQCRLDMTEFDIRTGPSFSGLLVCLCVWAAIFLESYRRLTHPTNTNRGHTQNREAAAAGGVHPEEPRVGQGAGAHAQDEEEGRDPGWWVLMNARTVLKLLNCPTRPDH